jgi:2-keto-4-pentenoate hydratase/2-oxohepta-3-ene-1,7-dioic acid hydratase in catechol pathway
VLLLGPVIVTADDIIDPQDLKISTRINGELRQHCSTSDMIWTCAGWRRGTGARDALLSARRDEVECQIDRIGTLRNTIQ